VAAATSSAAAPFCRYLRWFYGRLDAVLVPDRAAARRLVAGGLDASRVHVRGAGPAPQERPAPNPSPRA
jgi:hypothetical protein